MSRRVCCLALAVLLAATAAWGAPAAPGKRGRVTPPPHSVSRDNAMRAAARLAAGGTSAFAAKPAAEDTLRYVALRVDFPDLAFGAGPPPEYHDRFFYQNQFRYVSQYFDTASGHRLRVQIDVPDLVARAAHSTDAYGDVAIYDSSMVTLTSEAVLQSDLAVNYANYDGVLLIHAGAGQESDVAGDSPTQIWSGFLDDSIFRAELSTPDSVITGVRTQDGVEIRNIVVLPEWEVQDLQATGGTRLGSLGVYCHEIGQRLGMIPLFDASPRFPDSQGIGNFDVMGYGLWVANGFIPPLPSPFNRILMGWLQPTEVRASQQIVLADQERGAADSTVARVWISPREYFLVSYVLEDPDGPVTKICNGMPRGPQRFFEFEDPNGTCFFDYTDTNTDGVLSSGDLIDSYAGAEWDFFMTDLLDGNAGGGAGLLVLHIDEGVLQEVLATGSTNVEGNPRRKAVDVEEADGIEDLDRGPDNVRSFGSSDDFWPARRSFGPATIPDTRSVNGAPTGITIVLTGYPDSTAASPGGRAQVTIDFGTASATPASPVRHAWRDLTGFAGSDLVALPLGDGRSALVVAADSGNVLLADADLNEAPVSDGNPATLRPWKTLPPGLAGRWVGPPAVGSIDATPAPEVVLVAAADSAGVPLTRVFAWHADGTPVGAPSGLFDVQRPGVPGPPVVFETGSPARAALVVPRQVAGGVRIDQWTANAAPPWSYASNVLPGIWRAGPATIHLPVNDPITGLATVLADSFGTTSLQLQLDGASAAGPLFELGMAPLDEPVRLATGNLDAVGENEIVVASPTLGILIQHLDPGGQLQRATLPLPVPARWLSPLALADVDANGTLEILVASDDAMHVLSLSGGEMPGWPYRFRLEPGLESEPAPGFGAGSPLAVDVDGDGSVEILLQLPGGALLVWSANGARRHELEAALPARGHFTPLVADLGSGPLLAAVGQFQAAQHFEAAAESLVVAPRSQLAVWSLPRAGSIVWGEWGGGPGHAFHDATLRSVHASPNDTQLASFVVTPNPATTDVRARVQLTSAAEVRCRIFTLEGEMVREACQAGAAASLVEVVLDLRRLASGVYLLQMELSSGGRRTLPLAVRR